MDHRRDLASAAGYAAGALVIGTVVGTFALGPLVVAFGAAVAVGFALDWLDEKIGLSERLNKMLDDAFAKVEKFFREKTAEAEAWAKRVANSQTVHDLTRRVEDWWESAGQTVGRVNWSYLATSNFYGI